MNARRNISNEKLFAFLSYEEPVVCGDKFAGKGEPWSFMIMTN
jgi:hypothetical protein